MSPLIRSLGLRRGATIAPPDPGGGVTYVGSGYDANPGADRNTITIPKPTGVAIGDVMVASIGYRGTFSALTITPPDGWSLVIHTTSGGGDPNIATYVKVAGGSEPSTYVFGLDSNRYCAGGIAVFRGVDANSPIRDAQGVFDTTNNDPFPSAACGDGDAVLFVASHDANGPTVDRFVAEGATLAYGTGGASSVNFDMGGSYELNQAAPATGDRGPKSAHNGDYTLQTITLRAAT